MPRLQTLWWVSLFIFVLHQVLQYGYAISIPFIDSYLDALLCMPLLFGLWNWERAYWWKLPPLKTVEIILATLMAFVIFEVVYPYFWPASFVGDYWDGLAYAIGSLVFLKLNEYKR